MPVLAAYATPMREIASSVRKVAADITDLAIAMADGKVTATEARAIYSEALEGLRDCGSEIIMERRLLARAAAKEQAAS